MCCYITYALLAILGAWAVKNPQDSYPLLKTVGYCIMAVFKLVYTPRKSLVGETVLITGGGMGIGRLMALNFVKAGVGTLVIWDINEGNAKKVAEECRTAGCKKVITGVCDISDRKAVYAAANSVKKEVGVVTILVNNAGIVTGRKMLDCPDELMQKTMEVNTMAHFWTLKAFLPDMLERDHGHVVTIASTGGTCGVNGLVDYCASKFGAFGLDESLRMEIKALGKRGVKTTCVCPYFISTGMFDGAATKYPLILPILKPEYVADRIVEAVQKNQAVLVMPRFCYLGSLMRGILPTEAFDELANVLGVSRSMDDFKGRN